MSSLVLYIKNFFVKNKLVIILILAGFLTYANSLNNEFLFDDQGFILDNFNIKNFDIPKIFTTNTVAGSGIVSDYYRPLTSITFAIDYKFWGQNPFGFHLTNLILHILTGLILFLFLKKIKISELVSFFITLIFLVHPAAIEAVTYISSRGNIVYSLLTLLSLYLFAFSFNKSIPKISNKLLLLLSVLIYGVSIFGKEVALGVFPLYITVLGIFYLDLNLSIKKFHQKYRAQIIDFLFIIWIALMYMILRLYFLNFNDSLNFINAQNVYTENLAVRIYTFFKIIWTYLSVMLFPYPLYFERDTEIVTSFFSLPVISTILLIITALGLSIWEFKKKKTIYIFFGFLWMSVHLLPVSGVIPMTYLLHENWLYMPLVGLLIFIVYTYKLFLPKTSPIILKSFIFLVSAISITLIFLTIRQNTLWKNPQTFYEYNMRFSDSTRIKINLAAYYMSTGKVEEAKGLLKSIIDSGVPSHKAHYNLGVILDSEEKYKEAEQEYLATIRLDPTFLYTYHRITNLYIKMGQKEKAIPYIKILSEIYPEEKAFLMIYGRVLWETGNKELAEEQFKKAITVTNHNPVILKQVEEIKTGKVSW